MHKDDLSARIAGLPPVEPDGCVRERVLAAMRAAARETHDASAAGLDASTAIGKTLEESARLRVPRAAGARISVAAIAAGVLSALVISALLVAGGERTPTSRNPSSVSGSEDGPMTARNQRASQQAEEGAREEAPVGGPAGLLVSAAPESVGASVRPLIQASWMLERALDELPAQRRVMRAGTASTIAALEDRIAAIDLQLGSAASEPLEPEVQETLWQDRVSAMNALYHVRYGQSQLFNF